MRVLLLLFALTSSAFAKDEQPLTVAEQYELGLKYMKRGYYEKALEQFNRIRIYHRDDPLSLKAELALADVYWRKNEWDQARLAYEDFMRLHPRHPNLDYVVYRVGQTLLKKAPKVAARDQTWTAQVVNTWTGFDRRFPGSEWSDEVSVELRVALERLAKKELIIAHFYERRDAWRAVEGRAAGLVADFPDSAYVNEALNLQGEALARQGRAEEASAVAAALSARDAAAGQALSARLPNLGPED